MYDNSIRLELNEYFVQDYFEFKHISESIFAFVKLDRLLAYTSTDFDESYVSCHAAQIRYLEVERINLSKTFRLLFYLIDVNCKHLLIIISRLLMLKLSLLFVALFVKSLKYLFHRRELRQISATYMEYVLVVYKNVLTFYKSRKQKRPSTRYFVCSFQRREGDHDICVNDVMYMGYGFVKPTFLKYFQRCLYFSCFLVNYLKVGIDFQNKNTVTDKQSKWNAMNCAAIQYLSYFAI